MKKILLCVVGVVLVAWLWPSSLRPNDLTGGWEADEAARNYRLWFHKDGNLEVNWSSTDRFSEKPKLKIGWRIGRKGNIILIFTPGHATLISRLFGIPKEKIRNGLKGNQIVFQREKGPIFVKGEKIGEVQTLNLRPLYGLKYRFEDGNPEKLMIGKRVFVQTWSTW